MSYVKTQNGFTIMEIVIVLVIFSIIVITSSNLLLTGSTTYYNAQNILTSYWQSQVAIQRFERDLGLMKRNGTTRTTTDLIFGNAVAGTIEFLLSGSSLTRNGDTLADGIDVSNSSFTYYDKSMAAGNLSTTRFVKIQLKVTQNNSSYTAINTIFLRNALQ